MTQLLRTAHQGCWQLTSNSWGQYLARAADPDANVVLSDEQLQGFELHEGITRLPAELWARWIQLCLHFAAADKRQLEVSCRFLRREDDKSQWRIVIPPQAVGGASVRADSFDGSIDIATGEVIEQWPPDGWLPCGSSHSHNTMQALWSGTDDKYELGDPGLHIVVGELNSRANTYTLKASVTACGRRFTVDHDKVIDTTPVPAVAFHKDVLAVVRVETMASLWPSAVQQQKAGRGQTPELLTDDALWEGDELAPWDPKQWHAHHSAPASDAVVPLMESIRELMDELVDAAIKAGEERELDVALNELEDHLLGIKEDLFIANDQLNYYV